MFLITEFDIRYVVQWKGWVECVSIKSCWPGLISVWYPWVL